MCKEKEDGLSQASKHHVYIHIYRLNVLASRWLLLAGNTTAQPKKNERPPLPVNPFRIILLFVRWDVFVVRWSPTIVHVSSTDVPLQSSSPRIIWQIDSRVPFGNRNVMWHIFLSSSLSSTLYSLFRPPLQSFKDYVLFFQLSGRGPDLDWWFQIK